MDPARRARVEEIGNAVVAALGPSPEMPVLQRHLFDTGVHGVDAVLVTMRVMGVSLGEANQAFFSSPFRAAERDLQNRFVDVLELAAETDERQQRLCAEHQVAWTPPRGGSVVGVARAVGTGLWPVHGLRLPVEQDACGWYLWAGDGEMDQSPDFFEPVHVEHLYERCPEVLAPLGLPPGWRFLIARGYCDVWADPGLLAG
jgi:hypothetical protein